MLLNLISKVHKVTKIAIVSITLQIHPEITSFTEEVIKKITSPKMAERTLFIYIAAVLTFTSLPIDGQNVICKNADFRLINGSCYGVLPGEQNWSKAKDTCTSLNGKLATFDSLEKMAKIFASLGVPLTEALLVGTPREAQETGDFWSGDSQQWVKSYFLQTQICKQLLLPTTSRRSLCMEIDNSTPTNNPTTTSTPPVPKASCFYQDSRLIDGQCYRLSPTWLKWLDAKKYCESWNGTMATLSSVEQGMKVLEPFGNNLNFIWAITNPLKTEVRQFGELIQVRGGTCKLYRYGQSLTDSAVAKVLCME